MTRWQMASAKVLTVAAWVSVAAVSRAQPVDDQQSSTGPTPPESVLSKTHMALPPDRSTTSVSISNVPAYRWRHGCGPTAVGMVLGYYDGLGFDILFDGSAGSQTEQVDQGIASEGSGERGTGTQRHYEDYSLPMDSGEASTIADSSVGYPNGCHVDDSVADFMHTSWSSDGNYYGWSWSSRIIPAFTSYVGLASPNYVASAQMYQMSDNSLTWSLLVQEIDNNRPMVFLVDSSGDGGTDHFVTIVGYSDGSPRLYGCLDTWSPYDEIRWCEFRELSASYAWGVWGGWTFSLSKPVPGDVSASDGVYADKVRVTWSAATSASHYQVARATAAGGLKTSVSGWITSTTFDDVNALVGTQYYYSVRAALDAAGGSASDYSTEDPGMRGPAPGATAPLATTVETTGVGTNTATLHGTVDANLAYTVFCFEYGTDAGLGMTTDFVPVGNGGDPIEVSATIGGLSVDTVYFYRVVATSALGVAAAETQAFCTLPLAQTLLDEDFENGGVRPTGWTEENVSGSLEWQFQNGGRSARPPTAHGGSYNAILQDDSYDDHRTRLITPPIDFSRYSDDPTLRFWHAMRYWSPDVDALSVYVQSEPGGGWTQIADWTSAVEDWTERVLALPAPSSTYRIAFEGWTRYGFGVCVDDVLVTALQPRTTTTPAVGSVSATSGGGLVLQWDSATGHVYRIESVDALSGTFTAIVENILADPPVNTYTDQVDGVEHRFYRIEGRRP